MLNRRLMTALKGAGLLLVAALFAGMVYEQIGERRDRRRLPQIGRSLDLGGRTLNISCSGTGSPPVIFESAGNGPGLGWEPLEVEVARFTEASGTTEPVKVGVI